MDREIEYDVGIIGAGIAGSSLAICLALKGFKVVVIDQDSFPRHKVCGEFVSNESIQFFEDVGIKMSDHKLPEIEHVKLTSQNGRTLRTPLKMGGLGISRYLLDQLLIERMLELKVEVHQQMKVHRVTENTIQTASNRFDCKLIVGAFGKYRPSFAVKPERRALKNFIGVKYHIKPSADFHLPTDEISLHSFKQGYCGISKIEDDKYCLCYLVDAKQLVKHGNNIETMERAILHSNPELANIFDNIHHMYDNPLVISNIKFNKQATYSRKKGMVYLGDAAGSISPLSGNGMSMAARSANELAKIISHHGLNAEDIHPDYDRFWNKHLGGRVNKAKYLNLLMLNPSLNHFTLKILSSQKWLRNQVIHSMQGKTFGLG
ncbi:MAG: flavin-dependent dehydrogenase [Bacteroidia bacterium]|jgi:flavin-dependent dehydrogenase